MATCGTIEGALNRNNTINCAWGYYIYVQVDMIDNVQMIRVYKLGYWQSGW